MGQKEALAKLGLTPDEIQKVLADDKRIDRGENLFPLSAEQEKASKQARQADRAPTVYKLDNTAGKRSKKEDTDKADLLNALFTAILPMCDTYEITNAEREFCFTYHGRKFKVVLSAPRS
jgi:hypothetical protein